MLLPPLGPLWSSFNSSLPSIFTSFLISCFLESIYIWHICNKIKAVCINIIRYHIHSHINPGPGQSCCISINRPQGGAAVKPWRTVKVETHIYCQTVFLHVLAPTPLVLSLFLRKVNAFQRFLFLFFKFTSAVLEEERFAVCFQAFEYL